MTMQNTFHRGRRLRRTDTLRRLVRETVVTKDDLLYPMFVTHERESSAIASMPEISRLTRQTAFLWYNFVQCKCQPTERTLPAQSSQGEI